MSMGRIRRDLKGYLEEHRNPVNRTLHYFAFLAAFLAWIFLWFDIRLTLAFAVLHYVLAWTGHFYFEGNKPASFRYPLVGFYAGFLWFFLRTAEVVTRTDLVGAWVRERE
ncbi:Mpo1-like protein [Paenibacillus sp. 1P03SA]|uniref:Mpo1-like protein n=1 Tax=Paenibacillus sp. 1P03SA TaxID=3132294 RepID=UPI00399F8C35